MSFRTKLWIDHRVQGALVGRAVFYWAAGLLYFGMASWVSIYCENPTWSYSKQFQTWFKTVGPWLPSAVLILPLVVYDILRLSHSFVGPVLRARTQLAKIVHSPNCHPFVLRTDDYWHDLVAPIHGVQNRIRSLHQALDQQSEVDRSEGSESEDLTCTEVVAPARKIVCQEAANFQAVEEVSTAAS